MFFAAPTPIVQDLNSEENTEKLSPQIFSNRIIIYKPQT